MTLGELLLLLFSMFVTEFLGCLSLSLPFAFDSLIVKSTDFTFLGSSSLGAFVKSAESLKMEKIESNEYKNLQLGQTFSFVRLEQPPINP